MKLKRSKDYKFMQVGTEFILKHLKKGSSYRNFYVKFMHWVVSAET